MLHPDVELRFVDERVGYGLFARSRIPRGTITWTICALEQVFDPASVERLPEAYLPYLDKYAYQDTRGNRILCCDLARYMNHSCDPNTLTIPGVEIEVALRDIAAGEQVTDDYGTLNIEYAMTCYCGSPACRGVVHPDDAARHESHWESEIQDALRFVSRVQQPLARFLDESSAGLRAIGAVRRPAFHLSAE